jgi:NADPH:quinone reductase-like Zn-dependent oxidoreductase
MTDLTNTTTDLPQTATVVTLPGIVEPEGLLIEQQPVPVPAAGQVLVRVEAAGISFAEQQMLRGGYPGQPRFPFTPGYDLVGIVEAVGPGDDEALLGSRVAAMTKTGGWATHALVHTDMLVPVPAGVDPAAAATLIVNGLTAWKLLHRTAKVRAGQTIVVLGASGGVGNTLSQLARHAGIRVIGTASARNADALRALGVEPVDYRDPDVPARIRELAPGGVDAVFDHLGGPGLLDSFRLLRRGGTLVGYGIFALVDQPGNTWVKIGRQFARMAWWSLLPNGRRATFFDVWGGRLLNRRRFAARTREDLGQVFRLLADGDLTARVAARMPLTEVAEAMRLSDSGTVTGKVVLVP